MRTTKKLILTVLEEEDFCKAPEQSPGQSLQVLGSQDLHLKHGKYKCSNVGRAKNNSPQYSNYRDHTGTAQSPLGSGEDIQNGHPALLLAGYEELNQTDDR